VTKGKQRCKEKLKKLSGLGVDYVKIGQKNKNIYIHVPNKSEEVEVEAEAPFVSFFRLSCCCPTTLAETEDHGRRRNRETIAFCFWTVNGAKQFT
jgi:hypothetical protein